MTASRSRQYMRIKKNKRSVNIVTRTALHVLTHMYTMLGTQLEIISLDTGLRLDGLLALELWDLIVSVLGNISHISDRTGQPVNGQNKSHNKIDVMQDIDSVPSNVQSAKKEA